MNILRKMAAFFVQRLGLTLPQGWAGGSGLTESGERVGYDDALSISAVWACVNLLAGTASSLPLMVYRDRNGLREVDREHPLYRVLHDSPNYDQTAVDFWEFMLASMELWGNAYAKVDRAAGKVIALHPINPSSMMVKRLANGSIEYRWFEEGQRFVEIDRNMLHIRGFGGNPLGGLSTLHFARNAFGLARAIEKSASSMFRNGLRPSGVLTFAEWLSPEQRKTAETALADKFIGAVNSGRPLILEGGTKWETLTINPEDAQMLESRGFSVEEICRFFGVPPHMVGHTANATSWGTGLEQQTLGFQKFTLRRRLKRVEMACEKQLLTPADRAAGVSIEFNIEGLLRGDSAGRSAYYQVMTGIGAMTINEVREKENLKPVAGGDVPRMQMQNVPITQPAPPPVALESSKP